MDRLRLFTLKHDLQMNNNNNSNTNNTNNNLIQFFIIYAPSQQLQGQLQTQHSVYKQIQLQCLTWEKKHINKKK
jgi:hypothetical protein